MALKRSDIYIDNTFPLKIFTNFVGLRDRRTEIWAVESPSN